MPATCELCGNKTADRVVLRDDYGQVRMTTPAPLVLHSHEADTLHGMMDRFPFCTVQAECKPCRERLRQETEDALWDLAGDY